MNFISSCNYDVLLFIPVKIIKIKRFTDVLRSGKEVKMIFLDI